MAMMGQRSKVSFTMSVLDRERYTASGGTVQEHLQQDGQPACKVLQQDWKAGCR